MRGMRKPLVFACALLVSMAAVDRDAPDIERGTLTLRYVLKPIGAEHYTVTRTQDGVSLAADVDFTDRGGRIQHTDP